MNEIFKKLPIENYEDYEVSNLGNIRNKRGKILKLYVTRDGYLDIKLKKKHFAIHRLVALAFIDNPDNLPQVDHHDCNKKNNKVENLSWCTHQENQRNRGIQKNNTSGVKGIYWYKHLQKWRAKIMIDGIDIHLGYFKTIEEATEARQNKVNEVFGVFTHECERIH